MKRILSMILALLLMFSSITFSINAEYVELFPIIEEVEGFSEEIETYSEKDVVKIGDQSYATLGEALAAVNDGETIVLLGAVDNFHHRFAIINGGQFLYAYQIAQLHAAALGHDGSLVHGLLGGLV